jgi:hypothetical protein
MPFSSIMMPGLTPAYAHEAIRKMGWTSLPHPVHSPDLALSNYHLSGPVKDALPGCHFSDDNELKESFHDVLQSQGRGILQHWYTESYSIMAHVG